MVYVLVQNHCWTPKTRQLTLSSQVIFVGTKTQGRDGYIGVFFLLSCKGKCPENERIRPPKRDCLTISPKRDDLISIGNTSEPTIDFQEDLP